MTLKKLLWNASALVAAVNTEDSHHRAAYGFWDDHESCVHVFPAIAWFEFQATQSRLQGEGRKALRQLYVLDNKNYVLPIDLAFIRRCSEEKLPERFSTLRGADLIYACAAVVEEAELVTFDQAFSKLGSKHGSLRVIDPTSASTAQYGHCR